MPSGGAVAQSVHCGAGPVNTAVGIHFASRCIVFVYSDIASRCHSQLWCGSGVGSEGMRSVLDPIQMKCGSFKLFFFFFFLNELQNCSLSAKPRSTAPVKVQEPSVLNTICNVLLFFLYVQNVEMFLKLNKQCYILKIVL